MAAGWLHLKAALLIACVQPRAGAFVIIGAGFPKTGSNSLAAALEILGFKTYHAGQWHSLHSKPWLDVLGSAEPEERLFEMADELVAMGFSAAVDTPIPSFTLKLLEHFPTTKVILTERDMDAWFESFLKQGSRLMTLRALGVVTEDNIKLMELTNRELYNCTSHPPSEVDRPRAVAAHREHLERLRREVPAGQLLEFSVEQGWEPLCKFLGAPVPASHFPNPWSAQSKGADTLIYGSLAAFVTLVVVSLTACWRCAASKSTS